mmetsp:Transcript_16542/g.31445  ORF Transcript_16542/g.31445 Transcript_16542/m.31445 type:complete len:363 (-) Transcript_16542:146-1234(-)
MSQRRPLRINQNHNSQPLCEGKKSDGRRHPVRSSIYLVAVAVVLTIPTAFVLVHSDYSHQLSGLVVSSGSPSYQCPVMEPPQPQTAANWNTVHLDAQYEREDAHTMSMDGYVTMYHNTTYDNWGKTYEEVKTAMESWKRKAIIPFISPGDHVYESASGMGLNLLMLTEMLQEERGNVPITIHGNDYLLSSTVRANAFLDRILPSHITKGNFCVGDSADLSHVPSNAFDLVYTGYIFPMLNPLGFEEPGTRYWEIYHGKTWQDEMLRDMAQRRQEDFYAAWVGEMIRIAKPGKPIIVEQVTVPKGVEWSSWGGVTKSWWPIAIERYNWPIDPDSIMMENDFVFRSSSDRYHVFMRKLNTVLLE